MKKISSIMMVILLVMMSVSRAGVNRAYATDEKKTIVVYDDYSVEFQIVNEWENEYIANVTFRNTGDEKIYNWALMFEMCGEITSLWGASISDKENEVYIVKNCGYNANINPGECVEFGMQIRKDNASELILPEKFKIPVTYLEVDKNKYSTDVVKVSDYEVRLDVKNLSKDVISGWNIEFESDMSINSTAEGEMKKAYNKTTIQSRNYNAEIGAGETFSIHLYTDKNENSEISDIRLYENKIVGFDKYNICFTSLLDVDATENFLAETEYDIDFFANEKIVVDIKPATSVTMSDTCMYEGFITFQHDAKLVKEEVKGEMTLCNDGMIGSLHGYIDDVPVTAVVNYAFQNVQPYVFLAVNSIDSGRDYYRVFGKRQESNDRISDVKVQLSGNNNEQKESEIVMDESMLSDERGVFFANADTDYATCARDFAISYFEHEDAYYYLGALSLYMPVKMKSNNTYTVYAKVNTHDGNAQYYFQKKRFMPGMILSFDSTADLKIYTESTMVDIVKAKPETESSFFNPSVSLAIPVGDYLSLDFISLGYEFPGPVTRTLSQLNGSQFDNCCEWKFRTHMNADIQNGNPLTTNRGYSGYVKIVPETNKYDLATFYIVTEGTIYYEMTTRLVNYQYDSSFNVNMKVSELAYSYANTN